MASEELLRNRCCRRAQKRFNNVTTWAAGLLRRSSTDHGSGLGRFARRMMSPEAHTARRIAGGLCGSGLRGPWDCRRHSCVTVRGSATLYIEGCQAGIRPSVLTRIIGLRRLRHRRQLRRGSSTGPFAASAEQVDGSVLPRLCRHGSFSQSGSGDMRGSATCLAGAGAAL